MERGCEIIGKATRISDDIFIKYIQEESGRFIIDNYLTTVEEISDRLVRYLSKFLNGEVITQIRLRLREILINAIEHGNLNISYEEKKALEDDSYFLFIYNWQKDAKYGDKKIIVEYLLSPLKVVYRITDQGGGLNFEKINKKIQENSKNDIPHGRGLMMTMPAFDKVSYNEKGNLVTLVKRFRK